MAQYQLGAGEPASVSCSASAVNGGATGETNNLNETCCLDNGGGPDTITYEESTRRSQTCDLCGGIGQPCCALPRACNGPSSVCYSQTCEACGGTGQLCCAGSVPCTSSGEACQQGYCGLPDDVSISPAVISLTPTDGAALSLNYATTHATLTGAWAGSAAPSFQYYGLPADVNCSPTDPRHRVRILGHVRDGNVPLRRDLHRGRLPQLRREDLSIAGVLQPEHVQVPVVPVRDHQQRRTHHLQRVPTLDNMERCSRRRSLG